MSLRLTVISLIAVLMTAAVALPAEITPEEFRKLVASELAEQGRSSDSLGAPLVVTGLGEAGADFLLLPVFRDGKLMSLFRDDPRRDWVKEISSAVTLKSVKTELLSSAGLDRFLGRKNLQPRAKSLVSLGPLSLFGSIGAGWYLPTDGSFYLLSLEGRLASEAEVATFWPEKAELIRQLTRKTKTEADSGPEATPPPEPQGDSGKND